MSINSLFCGFAGVPVGSRVTCSPAPTDTDRDWLVLVPAKDWETFVDSMELSGWARGGSAIPNGVNELPEDARFNSFVKGEDNVIATCSDVFHKRFLAATHVATRFNLTSKSDRIALFQAVLYGNFSEGAP